MTKIIWIVVITAIASTLLITSIASTNLPAEAVFQRHTGQPETIPPAGDTIDDIQIRVVFYFRDYVQTVDSFRIFNQIEGYDQTEKPLIKLSGGGIVADSSPAREYAEVRAKSGAMWEAIRLAEEGGWSS